VRVVGPNAEQLGVLTIEQALARAQEEGLDLVEVNPMSKPPVCKIMDYGKFKYEEKKKASEAKKKQVVVHLKEVKLRPKTEEHDYEFKVRNVKRFLEEGNKARITIMFRGREITHREQGQHILEDVVKDTKDVGVVEQAPRMEGRQMYMILAPNPKILQKVREQARQAALQAERRDRPAGAPPPRPEKPVAARDRDAKAQDQKLRQEAHAGEEGRQGETCQGVRQAHVHLRQAPGAHPAQPRNWPPRADGRQEGEERAVPLWGELIGRAVEFREC
jgi:translation initiation factor IF-3